MGVEWWAEDELGWVRVEVGRREFRKGRLRAWVWWVEDSEACGWWVDVDGLRRG